MAVSYLRQYSAALQAEDGYILADLIGLQSSGIQLAKVRADEIEYQCRQLLPPGEVKFVAEHMNAVHSLQQGQFREAFKYHLACCTTFRQKFTKQKESNWGLTILERLMSDLRRLGSKADEEASRAGSKPDALEAAMTEIRTFFAATAGDRAPLEHSKKWGMMFLVNNLLAIAFKLNNFALVGSLVRTIETTTALKDEFYISHRVTYNFYTGRKAMFDARYGEAEQKLEFALFHCHKSSVGNKQKILINLIPVKLLLGRLPTAALLEKYQLPQFQAISEAVRTGNLILLKQALVEHQVFFIHWGIYLILEKLRILAFRTLFKKVVAIEGSTKIRLSSFLTALQFMQEGDIDLDEVECIVANMIHQKYIKGYIAHAQRMLVLSKQDPFPSLGN